MKSGGVTAVSPAFYGYLAAIVVMSVVCTVIQWRMFAAITDVFDKNPYMYVRVAKPKKRRRANQSGQANE